MRDGRSRRCDSLEDQTGIGTPPAIRYGHTGVYDAGGNRLIVFGGIENNIGGGTFDATFDDVWVLSNANGVGGTPVWSQLSPTGGPPAARWGADRPAWISAGSFSRSC